MNLKLICQGTWHKTIALPSKFAKQRKQIQQRSNLNANHKRKPKVLLDYGQKIYLIRSTKWIAKKALSTCEVHNKIKQLNKKWNVQFLQSSQ